MEFLARGLRRQAAQGGVQTRGSLLTERGEAFRQKRGWATHPGNRQAGQSRPDRSRIPGASHGPLLIPHCRVHTGPVKDGRTPTTEGLLKDIQRPQVAQPRDAFSPCGSLERSNRRFASRPNRPVRTEANTEPKGTTARRRKRNGDGNRQVKRCVRSRRLDGLSGTPGKSISCHTPPAPPRAT